MRTYVKLQGAESVCIGRLTSMAGSLMRWRRGYVVARTTTDPTHPFQVSAAHCGTHYRALPPESLSMEGRCVFPSTSSAAGSTVVAAGSAMAQGCGETR